MSGIFGCIHPHSSVSYTCPLYEVKIEGVGTNVATINALGQYGVFEGARLTIEAIKELTPILATNGYRARISAGKVIIEPIPRNMLVSIENHWRDRVIQIMIYNEEGHQAWYGTLKPESGEWTVLPAGSYNVKSSVAGNAFTWDTLGIPDRPDYWEYSRLAKKSVNYRINCPRWAE